MTSFFEQCGRKLFEMVGDGNCLYRGISYQLFGTQEQSLKQQFEIGWPFLKSRNIAIDYQWFPH